MACPGSDLDPDTYWHPDAFAVHCPECDAGIVLPVRISLIPGLDWIITEETRFPSPPGLRADLRGAIETAALGRYARRFLPTHEPHWKPAPRVWLTAEAPPPG
jgi:hypothetical protein